MKTFAIVISLASFIATPTMAGTLSDEIRNNSGVQSAWQAEGQCDHNESYAARRTFQDGKWITVEKRPLDCTVLISMTMTNGRSLFQFTDGNKIIGFGSNGNVYRDEDNKNIDYVAIDHFYPGNYAFWGTDKAIECRLKHACADNTGMIANNVNGRCAWAVHKGNITFDFCSVIYSPDGKHSYTWEVQLTEEKILTIK
jgi:hypothetical protein